MRTSNYSTSRCLAVTSVLRLTPNASHRSRRRISKRRPSLLVLGLGCWLAAFALAQGQVSFFETVSTVADASAYSVAADGAGNVYVGGELRSDGGGIVVLKSPDHGAIWDEDSSGALTPIFQRDQPSWVALAAATIQVPEPGSGSSVAENNVVIAHVENGRWFVHRSADAGATFQTIDNFAAYSNPWTSDATLDAWGNIYVVGRGDETVTTIVKGKPATKTVTHALVRKGTRNAEGTGYQWATVGKFPNGSLSGVTTYANCVFVVGSASGYWDVRKSSDYGATWTLVDHFIMKSRRAADAREVAADAAGNIFVVGIAEDDTNRWVSVVRRASAIGTSSFQTVDVFNPASLDGTGTCYGMGVAVDAQGNVHTTGSSSGPATVHQRQWFVRTGMRTVNNTWSWSTTDQFLAPYTSTAGYGLTANPVTGSLFSIGGGTRADGTGDGWIVRGKLAIP